MSPVDIANPDLERFPNFARSHRLECVLRPGDVLFMPAFWWHEVQSYPDPKERRNLAVNYWWASGPARVYVRGSSYDGYGRCSLHLNICLSQKPHPLQREKGSGLQLMSFLLRNTIIKQRSWIIRCWYQLNMLWCNCYSITTDAIYEQCGIHWSQQVSTVATIQMAAAWLDPSSLCKGCGMRDCTFVGTTKTCKCCCGLLY